MKKFGFIFYLVLQSVIALSQVPETDTVSPNKGKPNEQVKEIKKEKIMLHSDADSNGTEPRKTALIDTTKTNKYADLLRDDPQYNKKYPLWVPATEVVAENAILNVVDRSVMHLEFAQVNPST